MDLRPLSNGLHAALLHALAAGGSFTGEKVMEINRKFDTNFLPLTEMTTTRARSISASVKNYGVVLGLESVSRPRRGSRTSGSPTGDAGGKLTRRQQRSKTEQAKGKIDKDSGASEGHRKRALTAWLFGFWARKPSPR